ncbi:CLUMA_CG009323, isoform A [Clunio marinus]|uniref:CLUMA_CG009323, isoform A n=1 Tax=Clunio marinus TaxID=568069 RepID=A0A1J1I8H9_9DIPT|nr:CLUMA_CG009323, isoform A [Clunio marinus]
MSVIKYIGRRTDFRGKSMWEIVSNLKNFGVGRILVRSMFERYPENSWIKILKVEACPPTPPDFYDTLRRVKITAERVFRGKKFEKPILIEKVSYKTDYRLLSKKEEADYCKLSQREEKLLPLEMDLPPLLREFVFKETGRKDVKMKIVANESLYNNARRVKENETPNCEVPIGLGTPHPTSRSLYEGIELK